MSRETPGPAGTGGSAPPEHVSIGRMNDALDGLLDHTETARLERHLLACTPCRDEYARLAETVHAMRALPKAAEPPEPLWGAIEAQIRAAADDVPGPPEGVVGPGADVVHLPARAPRARLGRRFDLSGLQLAAAALVVSLLSAGAMWMAVRGIPGDARAGSLEPGRAELPVGQETGLARAGASGGPAARAVSSDPERYADAARRLEEILAAGRQVLAPETLASIERSLDTIDAAIADVERALAADPGSDMLRRLLSAHRGTRLGVLQRAAAAVQSRV